jgi:hypothetical protein
VSRGQLLDSSVRAFAMLRRQDLLKPLRIRYAGEEGIDSGGLVKDWFIEVSRCLVDGNLGVFLGTDDNPDIMVVDPRSEHLHTEAVHLTSFFRFVGRFLGKAVFDRQVIDLRLETTILKQLVGEVATLADLAALDGHRHRGLQWMLENPIGDVLDETFSVGIEVFGEVKHVELLPGGLDRPVTDANKTEYVDLMVRWATRGCVETQLAALVSGFHDLVPLDSLRAAGIAPPDLLRLFLGQDELDVSEIEAAAKYLGGYDEESPQVSWFWEAMRTTFADEERRATIRFVTGLHKVPLDGFDPPFTIMASTHESGAAAFPKSHTCFNQLVLPPYNSPEELVAKMRFAIANASSAFLLS